MKKFDVSRRGFLAGGTALGAGSVLFTPQMALADGHLAGQELRTVGLSVTVQERILNDFKEKSGVGLGLR